MNKIISNIITKVLYMVAIVLLIMAVGVTVARLVTPILNNHRADFEVWASKILERPVKIGRVRAWWEGFEPDLKLENVSVYDKNKQDLAIKIDELQVGINFFKSLFMRRLEPSNILINGVHLIIHQLPDGTIQVNGISTDETSMGNKTLSSINSGEMIDWLLSRPRVSLSSVSVKWYTPNNKGYSFFLRQLEFDNSGDEHSLRGYVTLLQASPMHLHFGVYLQGNIHDKKHLKVIVYGDLQNVLLSQWIGKQRLDGLQIFSGIFNGQVWLKWHHQRWETVQSLYDISNLKLTTNKNKTPIIVQHASGNLFASLGSENWNVISQFDHLNFSRWNDIPGITNLSGTIQLSANQGEMNLNSTDTTFDFGKLFPRSLFFSILQGHLNWSQTSDKGWQVTGSNLIAQNDDLTLNGEFGLLIPTVQKEQPILSVLSGFTVNNPSNVKYYLPVATMHSNMIEWLNDAFLGGDEVSGTVILRGPIDDFPFDHHDGIFVVDSEVHNMLFHYAQDWPDAHNVNAKLIFKNRAMICDVTSGEVNNIQLKNAHAVIPYMGYKNKSEELNLDINALGDAADLLQFIHHSPLEESVGQDLLPIQLHGNSNFQLKLNIPLMYPHKTKLDGNVSLSNVDMTIPEWGIEGHSLNGHILFTEKSLSSDQLQATVFNQPMSFSLKTAHEKDNTPYTQINIASKTTMNFLKQRFSFLQNSFISGEAHYQAQLMLRTAKGDKRPNTLSVSSDLSGIAINLPQPLGKTADTSLPFKMSVTLNPEQPVKMFMTYGKIFSGALLLNRENQLLKLFSVNLHLGSGSTQVSDQKGIFIDGYLPTFDWQVWKNYFDNTQDAIAQKRPGALAEIIKDQLQNVNIKIGKINVLGQPLSDIKILIQPAEDGWQIGLDSMRIAGQLLLPNDITEGITGKFKRLYLIKDKSLNEKTKTFNPASIPPLDIQTDNFQYGDQYFGSVNLISNPIQQGMNIRQFIINSPLLYASMNGSWKMNSQGVSTSHLIGLAKTNNLDHLLKSLNIHSSLVGTDGKFSFDFTWPGPVYSPAIKNVTGDMNVKLGKGWIVDLGESTNAKLNLGRLLTLLSINRLLVMNFDDLSQKGYGFDTMEGKLDLKSGQITMKDLLFDGSVARIISSGSINLVKETLDLDLTITPYLTSSLPIVATIAGGPIVGVATWVANKVFSKAVAKITTYYYSVTGSWHKPNVQEEYKGAKAPVEDAA